MTRCGPSRVDQSVISELAGRGVIVSPAQLERWRHAGLMPRNTRQGLGRGRGSASVPHPEAVEIAAALARHAGQGRDLRLTVIDWFAEAGEPVPPGQTGVPEPPFAAVRSALAWMLAATPVYQLQHMARAALTDPEADDVGAEDPLVDRFYAAADQVLGSVTPWAAIDVTAIRTAILNRREITIPGFQARAAARSALIQLVAASGMGVDKLEPDLVAQSYSDIGLGQVDPVALEQLTSRLTSLAPGVARELAEQLILRYDPMEMLTCANAEWLMRARETAQTLAGIGALLMCHALLMPDTPRLRALRDHAIELGLQPFAVSAAFTIDSTAGFAYAVINGLHPFTQALCKTVLVLAEAEGQHWILGDGQSPDQFMAEWRAALRDLSP